MSLSLSSLLNPSPDADAQQEQQQPAPNASPPLARKDSLPPIPFAQSPIQQDSTSPHGAYQQGFSSYNGASEQDAVQALAALSSSTAAPPVPSQWYAQAPAADDSIHRRRSSTNEQRPGSSGMQLPPPAAPHTTTERKMSSPTSLDQYHVASKSPVQRRASLISPSQSNMTLPPIQSLGQQHADQMAPAVSERDDGTLPASYSGISGKERGHVLSDAPALPPNPYTSLPVTAEPDSLQPSTNLHTHPSPSAPSPTDALQTPTKVMEGDSHSVKAITSLKNEHGLRPPSPLRESSVPIQSTEVPTPESTNPRKRPAPKNKKGMATTKKAPPSKRRKVELKRSLTPSSRASKPPGFKTGSSMGTPANSSPAPTTRSQSADADDEPYDEDDMDEGPAGSDDELYCICRKPDNGTFMIGCDGTCDDWFHGKCVNIEERDRNLIDKYICPSCEKAGIGETTWKRICRRARCRQPARIGKTKTGKEGSKYCSDECGVQFFRDRVAETRGKEDMARYRSSRRKSNIVHDHSTFNDDLGARGGVIAAGELKALVNASKTADDFKKLGGGVLSPPSTPDSKSPTALKKNHDIGLTDSESATLEDISNQKDEARKRHQLLKDRMKFVTMAKQAASRTAVEKELKPKEYCGYDSRIEWTAEQFQAWRNSKSGKQAFELDTLATEERSAAKDDTDAMEIDSEELADFDICDRRKCARHMEWTKLAVDDVRFEMNDNSDHMHTLNREEREIRERAALRQKAGSLAGEGRVEVHGLGITTEAPAAAAVEETIAMPVKMEVDAGPV